MRKYNWLFFAFLFAITVSLSFLTACSSKNHHETEQTDDDDLYDGPDKAVEQELEMTKDPATGKVPWQKLLVALNRTKELKDQLVSSRITSLNWIERGSNSDATGPSNGNTRANNGVTSGRVRAVMVDSTDPTHKTVWIGGVDGGLWKTSDITAFPATWTLVNDFMSNLAISAICQDPRPGFTNNMYLCTGESYFNADAINGVGVFKSTDGGVTWNFLPSSSSYTACTRILCDFQGNVYLATRSTGLLRSNNGGSTWTNITPSGVNSSICDLEISSTAAPARLHMVTGIFSAQTYRYTDAPATVTSASGWNAPTTPFPTYNNRAEIAVSGNVLYALPDNASHQVPTIYKSTDGGDNWVATTGQPAANWASGQGWYSLSVGIDPSNPNNCIVGGLDNYKTTDGGATWTIISHWVGTAGQYVHADQHSCTWWDGGNKLLFSCDGGVHFSSDGGTTIRDRNVGLRLKQFYSVAIHPTTTDYFIAGAQDNGVHQLTQPGLGSSIEVTGGDGMIVAIDQNEPQYQFGSYVYNNYRRSTNSGATWSQVNFDNNGRFTNPFDYDNNTNIFYAADVAGQYLRWDNPQTGSTSALVAIPSFAGGQVSAICTSPYTANRVYFGTGSSRIVKVDNANTATPTDVNITGAGMSGYVNCIVTGTSDQNLLACFSNYGVMNVWVSNNGGTTWTGIDGNLPDMPVRWALFNPDDNTKAYIATETGVWETDLINGASTVWTPNPSFPNVSTDMLRYRSSDRTIAAATHGRGLWTAVIPPLSGFSFSSPAPAVATCPAPATMSINLGTSGNGGFTNPITLTATGNPGGTTVTFAPSNVVTPGNSVTVTLNNTNTLAPNSYVVAVSGTASGAPNQSVNLTYTINPGTGPVISVQPAPQTVCEGSNAVFNVTAAGVNTYQWQLSTDGGTTYNNIGGATTSSYTVVSATAAQNNNRYRVILTGQCGTTTSTGAILTVNPATAITSQPTDVTLCTGNSNTFCVTAVGTGLTYQWQSAPTCASPFTNIVGAVSSCYTVSNATVNAAYRCVVTGTCGGSVTSSCASLTVVNSVTITTQPTDQTVCVGSNANFTVAGSGSGVIYQWQLSTDGGTNYNNIAGATNATLTLTGVTVSMNGYKYRAILSNATCTVPSTSNAATLTVQTLPAISTQPLDVTLCVGGSNTFSVTASGTAITYQWQVSTDGGVTYTNIAGATSSTYLLSGVTAAMNNNRYRCVVSGTCTPSATSSAALLTVISPVTITTQPTNTSVCAGSSTSFTVVGSSSITIVYQWQVSTDGGATWTNIAGATSATLNLNAVPSTLNNNRYRVLLSNATCTTPAVSNGAILTVNALPTVSWLAALADQCISSTSYTLIGGIPGGGVISGVGVTGGGTIFNASIAGLGPHILTYTYTDPNGCVNTATKTITVNPLPTVTVTVSPYTRLFPGLTTTLTATTSPATGVSVAWLLNGNLIPGYILNTLPVTLTGPTASITGLGTYQAKILDGNGCANQSSVITIADSASSKLFIYPSPNDGQFTVAYYNAGGNTTQHTIAVYDSHGAMVYNAKLAVAVPYQLHSIDLRPAAHGVYIVVVGDANGKKLAEGKVMIQF